MTLPENFYEGLNLAGSGMALVFAALVVFMLILIALQKLFPGEEMEPELEMPAPEATEEAPAPLQVSADSDEEAPEPVRVLAEPAEEVPEPSTVAETPADGRMPGPQVAAMAVAIYLAMERDEQAQLVEAAAPEIAVAATPEPAMTLAAAQARSGWGAMGRAAMLESQGRRAPSYNHRPQSPFNPRGRDRR